MNTYLILKHVHVGAVVVSGIFFLVRGVWMWRESVLLQSFYARVLPHIIDTVLLVSALWLAYEVKQYPFQQAWLTVKLVVLLLYIVVGSLAIKRGKTRTIKKTAFFIAVMLYLFMITVALSHNPLGLFASL